MGDSRVYLIRGKKIEQLTVDHSIAQALVEAKTISAAEARTHRYRNVLWKYLGSQGSRRRARRSRSCQLQAGDRFLLCTDGLTGVVPDEQLLDFINDKADVQECADGLGQLALDSGLARQHLVHRHRGGRGSEVDAVRSPAVTTESTRSWQLASLRCTSPSSA